MPNNADRHPLTENKEVTMKRMNWTIACAAGLIAIAGSGCATRSGSATVGVLGGAAAGVGGYEYYMKRKMDQLEDDFKAGKIDQQEYEARKDQIKQSSVFQ
jgi:hypothetical protein